MFIAILKLLMVNFKVVQEAPHEELIQLLAEAALIEPEEHDRRTDCSTNNKA